ncbi:hypothetical protein, partial [Streptomyces sp. Ru87]|uniref:hypothetical protein n=1 Tax=Streptomyces sp. Ru87 TaxID=2044307 RepID=UPI000C01D00E
MASTGQYGEDSEDSKYSKYSKYSEDVQYGEDGGGLPRGPGAGSGPRTERGVAGVGASGTRPADLADGCFRAGASEVGALEAGASELGRAEGGLRG